MVDMLQRNIDVARDLVALCDSLNQFIAPMRGVCVKQTHPEFAFNLLNLTKQRCERRPASRIDGLARPCFYRPQIHAVVRSILTDQVDFAHAFADERANFCNYGLRSAAAMSAAHLGNHAKTAWVIAAFSYFYVRKMCRRKPETRRVVIRNVSGPGVRERKIECVVCRIYLISRIGAI